MDRLEQFRNRLIECFAEDLADLEVQVEKVELGKYSGSLVSPTFEGMDDIGRQNLIWGRVLKCLNTDEQWRLAFLYPSSPTEHAAHLEAEVQVEAESRL